MNTKLIMIASAVLMGILGILCSFMPEKILHVLGQSPTSVLTILIQLTGALYIGFASVNWMAKTQLIGGIYSRPLAIGNFAHFLIGGLALLKFILRSGTQNIYLTILTIAYLIFAILFAIVFQKTPRRVIK